MDYITRTMEKICRINEGISFYEKMGFYKKRSNKTFITDVDELKFLPTISKDDLRALKPYELLNVDIKQVVEYHESFGTTGEPVSMWFTKSDFDSYVHQINESAVNFNENDIALIRFPYAISVPAHIFTAAIKQRGGCVIPASRGTLVTPYTRVIKLMKKLNVTILACNPHEAFLLAKVSGLMGLDSKKDFNCLRAICVAGEMLSDERKKRLEKVWNVEVYNFYGTTETGNMATSCQYGNLHCSDDDFIFEVLDPVTNEKVNDGEKGILHITTLKKDASPLVRYNLDDVVQIQYQKCRCGLHTQILKHYGRYSDRVEINGKTYFYRELEEELLSHEEIGNEWKIRIEKNQVVFVVECEDISEKNRVENVNLNLDIPYRIIGVDKGSIINPDELVKIVPFGKPVHIEKAD